MATTLSSQLPNPPPPLEVRCAGCGETLELEPGMIEFICPDCHTPQTLPPELMPRKRKALPMPRGVGSSKIQLPCGSCSALLNVPHGLARFVCPKCGVELAVDQEKLRGYLAGSSVAAADVAVVVPSAVRLPLAVDVEPQLEVTNPSFRAPLFSPAANIEQNHMITPSRAQQDLSINSDHLDQSPLSRTLFSSSINANNIHTSIPSSTTPVPCRLNAQQIEEPEEKEEQKENEEQSTPTPPHTTRTKPIKKENNKNKKRSVGPTTKEIESSLRRSKRLAQSSPPTKKHKTQSQPSQSQPIQIQPIQSQPSQGEDNETPLDIARHYNNLLLDPGSPNGQGDLNNNSDDEGDEEAYVAESDSSQSEPVSQKKRGSIRVFSPSEDSEKRPRKGRGPNKLPNVPAPQNRPLIVIASDKAFAMKDKSLSNAKISRLIGNLVRQHTPGVVSFSDWDKTSKELIWNEFLKYYQLDVNDGNMESQDVESDIERDAQDVVEREARKVFESWAKTLYRKALNQARDDLKKTGIEDPTEWAKHPPKFMEKHKDAWAECCQIWSTEEWQEKSRRATENRQAGAEVVHLGGSVNSCEIMRKLQQDNPDRTITYIDVAKKMKMRPSGEWVDLKAQQTVGDYETNMINEHGENWREKHPDDPNIWLASSGGNNHGHIYMIGSVIKSKRLKKRHGSRRTKPALKSSSSHDGRWITKDGSNKVEDLNKQHEEDRHEIERLRKQHEEDRKEIEMLREKQMEQDERSRLLEEKQSSGREEMDSLREEMMEMRKMIKIASSASSTPVMPRRALRSQPRPSYHE